MSESPTANIDAAERLVDIAAILAGSSQARDILPLLMLAQAVLLVTCSPDPKLADTTAEMGGAALADLIREVQAANLTNANPGGTA